MLSRNGKLDPIWTRAQNGNVALIGEIDFTQANEVTLALGFGQHPGEAAQRVRSSLNFGFARACADFSGVLSSWEIDYENAKTATLDGCRCTNAEDARSAENRCW